MLRQLQRVLAEAGCESIFLPGNHDPGWEGGGHIELAGGRIAITHGDALLRDGAPWKREMLAHPEVVDELWSRFPAATTDITERLALSRAIAQRLPTEHHPQGRSVLSRALDAALPPRRALEMISAWLRQGAHGALFCENYLPKAKVLVIGHFHRRCVRQVRGINVVNTGSFCVPGAAGWVEWDGAALTAGRVDEKGKTFAMERKKTTRKLFQVT